ncbi:hypothetical protein ABR30_0210875 [Enterobacter ludwigii]|nr:hypothetical protein ABR30_0210875 [Enterobacter ludwigii]
MRNHRALNKLCSPCSLIADFAKTAILAAPAYLATRIGHLQLRTIEIGTEPVNLTAALVTKMIIPAGGLQDSFGL